MGLAKLEERQAIHARKLREVLVSLGPTFIKVCQSQLSGFMFVGTSNGLNLNLLSSFCIVCAFPQIGQALSNRPDLVGPVYKRELELLQDTVAPFPDKIAFQIIEAELGRPANEVFEFLQEKGKGPVASASLGQVYKARVRETGQLVAVKVCVYVHG